MNQILSVVVGLFFISYNDLPNVSSLKCRHLSPTQRSFKLQSTLENVIELTKDGGVKKNVIMKGQGRKIEPGDILAIEYKASVTGSSTPFAKGDKEQFIVKDGSLIKGWDIAIESMRIGEKSTISCSAPYAYGSKGVKPVIPSNADLELEIKVLAWLGNQMRPESLFQKDLDIDPFVSSTPEAIQADYDEMQVGNM